MTPKGPVIVVDLLPEERDRLLELLRSLAPEKWQRRTSCPGWSVRDVAAHILGDDLNNLAGRDGHREAWFEASGWAELVSFINERNEAWVGAMRRVSPQALTELLSFTGEEVQAYFASLDPMAEGPNVAWAGRGPMPAWMHIAREYTERWLDQTHIREAVGAKPLYERRLFHPVLATFVHALPVAYESVEAPPGTAVSVEISGDAGGASNVEKRKNGWELREGPAPNPAATVRLDQDVAWRLWTKGVTPREVVDQLRLEGDRALGEPALRAVAIIA